MTCNGNSKFGSGGAEAAANGKETTIVGRQKRALVAAGQGKGAAARIDEPCIITTAMEPQPNNT